jgi:site-specific recombinase XerD
LKEILLKYRKKSGWCFLNSEGGQFKNNLLKRFKAICKKAGIEDYHLHTLRHTFASQLVMAGVSIYKVSQWLGHSDVTTTMIYAHLEPQDADINRI